MLMLSSANDLQCLFQLADDNLSYVTSDNQTELMIGY